MSPLSRWRMLPPAGAPLPLSALVAGLKGRLEGSVSRNLLSDMVRTRFGARHVFFADTGRAALSLLLSVLHRRAPQRDQVLIPAYVSFSVPSAVVNAGLRVALYDVDPRSLTPDYESMRASLTEQTLAVVICPQFGLPFDPSPAAALCRDSGTVLVDDAAQAMGAHCGNRTAGCLGDAGLFSLSRGKPMTAVDGGILLTDDEAIAAGLAEAAEKLPPPGGDAVVLAKALALLALRRPELYRLPASLPWLRLGASVFEPEFQPAAFSDLRTGVARVTLENLDAANADRAKKAALYREKLAAMPGIELIAEQPDTRPIHLRFPLLPGKNALGVWDRLIEEGRSFGISRGYPLALNRIPELRGHLAGQDRNYAGADTLAQRLITLPTHEHVRPNDCMNILAHISAALEGAPRPSGRNTP